MKSSYKKIGMVFCLFFVFLLPLSLHAALTGEIIYRHPLNHNELWIGNVNDVRSARSIFKLPHIISTFSIQKDGRYIVTVVKIIDNTHEFASYYDIYLLDRKNPNAAIRLTQGEYSEIIDADVSPDRDVVFTNHSFVVIKNLRKRGLYLISDHEIEKTSHSQNCYWKRMLIKLTTHLMEIKLFIVLIQVFISSTY